MSQTRLLNTKIAQFYKIREFEEIKSVALFFEASGSFNSTKIVKYLWPNLKSDKVFKDLANYKYEDFLQCSNKLLPIFHYTTNIFKDYNKNTFNNLKIQWMGNNVNAYLDMKNSYSNDKTETFEHTLILTSLLSNAMTNVYLSQNKAKHAPHLLKDLINSLEIVNVFGLEMTILLKILMGSPNSINLRNIVWHGFPKPGEIPSYYVNVLLITIHSLGCIIESKNIQTHNRNQITNFNEHIKVIELDLQLKPLNLAYLEEKLQELDNDFKIYWQQLLKYYEFKKYKEFIILVLPQIELLLRLHYGKVNNCDISAKLNEYYVTIDTIFKSNISKADEVEEISNKLLDFENLNFEGCFHLLYDIFLSSNGCRLRDKVSHGEVYLEALNNSQLCLWILHIFFALLYPQEFKIFENYESKLHLNSATKFNLIKSYEKLKTFCATHLGNNKELTPNSLALDFKILIFKRPKKEAELMLLINRIAENVSKTILNYDESIEIRRSLLAQRELHSNRRKTLENLENALPDIFKTLALIISSISKIFMLLQNDYSYALEKDHNFDKTLRFLKRCLTISENLLKHSHCENNIWIKSLVLCRKYDEFYKKLYLYDD